MSFTNAFKSAASKAETEIATVSKEVEADLVYSADTAVTNIKAEAVKLETLIESKLASIASHNKAVATHQAAVTELQADVTRAKALKEKVASVVS